LSKNLSKNKEVSLNLYLAKDLDPFFFEFLTDTLGNSNNNLFSKDIDLNKYLQNLIFLNILSAEIVSSQLDQRLPRGKKNLVYLINKRLNSSKKSNKDMKYELFKVFFRTLKSTKHNCFLFSETSNLIKNFKNYLFI